MESKAELYHHGLNPYYFETFNDDQCIHVLFALESLRIPYTRVARLDHDVKSLCFYLPDNASLEQLRKSIEDGQYFTGDEAYSKYALVYENSFV